MHRLILANADKLRDLHEAISRTYRQKAKSPDALKAWADSCSAFHDRYDALAWPGGLEAGLKALQANSPVAVETAVAFLEADPLFHRSGYLKAEVIRRLKHVALRPEQAARLRAAVLQRARGPSRREFRAFCKLAAHLNTDEFAAAVAALTTDADARTARHAGWLQAALLSGRARPDAT